MKLRFLWAAILLSLPAVAVGQQTIFNVPSGSVLDRGKVYGEFDFSYRPDGGLSGYTPRVVAGIGHGIEVGMNLNGISHPGPVQTTPTPAIKWKFYDGGDNGWALLAGDDVFIPVQNRTFDAGNYVWLEATKTFATKTRLTAGAYHFTRDVVAHSQHAGGQFGIEQPAGKRVTLAADWFTGTHALGYVTPGVAVQATSKLTLYAAWQLGNAHISSGNHQLLLEFGYNLN